MILHLTGLTSVAALKRNVEIPYEAIEHAAIENTEISPLQFRIGTAFLGDDTREGKFYIDGDWCFASFKHHEKVIVLDLKDHTFKKVMFEVEQPEEIMQTIEAYRKASN